MEKRDARAKIRQREKCELPNKEGSIEGQKVKLAFMDHLLDIADNGGGLTDNDIRNEVDTFMAAVGSS
jgi:HSP90 family molecular chaperone